MAGYRERSERYMLAVIDFERDQKFAIYFEPLNLPGGHAFEVERAALHRSSLAELWREIKKQSPGTYLDAKARGWVPEDVTRYDIARTR